MYYVSVQVENKMLEGPVRDPSELGAVELVTIISE